jgi:hypothetical protein
VTVGHRASGERHANAIAHVETRAAHFREIPVGTEIARAHLAVRLEAAAREHHGACAQRERLPVSFSDDSADFSVLADEVGRGSLVQHRNTELLRDRVLAFDKPLPCSPSLADEPCVELHAAVDLLGLAHPHRLEADAFALHPRERRATFAHENLGEVGIAAILRAAAHVLEEFRFGVRAEIGIRDFLVGQVEHFANFVDVLECEARGASRESAVAAALRFGCALEHYHARSRFLGRVGRAHGCVSSAHYNDIPLLHARRRHQRPSAANVTALVSGRKRIYLNAVCPIVMLVQ